MAKVLLLFPPQNEKVLAPTNFEPLPLEILAATVPRHSVKIIDLRFDSLSYLKQVLLSFSPDIVGITVNNTIDVNAALKVLRFVKEILPGAKNIVGGNHPTLAPYDFYSKDTDAIFIGWAEKTFPLYINSIDHNELPDSVSGVIYLNDGIPVNSPKPAHDIEADDVPLPDRQLTAAYTGYYKDELGRPTTLVNTSRGCPYRCVFCACWKAARGKYFVRNAKDVFEEVKSLPTNTHRVLFADDNTFSDIKRAKALACLLQDWGVKKEYSGYCRADTIVNNPELFRMWKKIGLANLTIGIEATNDRSLTELNKSISSDINQEAIRILNDFKISFSTYFLIDPGFEEKDFKAIGGYIEHHNIIRPRFVITTPLPGTSLYQKRKAEIMMDYDYFDFMHWVTPTRLKEKDFFNYFTKLYYDAFSLRRYLKLLLTGLLSKLITNKSPGTQIHHLPLIEVVLSRVMAHPLKRKLYKQYFKSRSKSQNYRIPVSSD
ncbi:MAG: radical SAM protein [candidate division Zixibacteria bacterium]|nr:radical SAM protein [candidate division Zixibacteria bacterium]